MVSFKDYLNKLNKIDQVDTNNKPTKDAEDFVLTADDDSDEGLANLGSPNVVDPMGSVGQKPSYKDVVRLNKPSKKNENAELLEEKRNHLDNYMRDHMGNKFTPHLHDVSHYLASISDNPKVAERIVRDIKRNGSINTLVAEMMNHPETYNKLVESIGDFESGPKYARKLVGTMHKKYTEYMQRHHGKSMNEEVSPSRDDMPLGGLTMPPNPVPDSGSGANMSAFGDERTTSAGGVTPDAMPAPAPDVMAMNEPEADPSMNASEAKIKMAHDNLMEAMVKYDYMKNKMENVCKECM